MAGLLRKGNKKQIFATDDSEADEDDKFQRAPDEGIGVQDGSEATLPSGMVHRESQLIRHVKKTLFKEVAKDDIIKSLLSTTCK